MAMTDRFRGYTDEDIAQLATKLWRQVKHDRTTYTYTGNGWFNQLPDGMLGAGVNWGRKKTPGFKMRRAEVEGSIVTLEKRIEREAKEKIARDAQFELTKYSASVRRHMLSEALTQYLCNSGYEAASGDLNEFERDKRELAEKMLSEVDAEIARAAEGK